MTAAEPEAQLVAGVASERGWIQSPGYDLTLIVLSPVVGTLAVLWALHLPGGAVVVAAVTFLLAIPHYMSSFSFFLGDENRHYYSGHALLFYGGPVAIALAVLILRGTGAHTPVMVTMFVWNSVTLYGNCGRSDTSDSRSTMRRSSATFTGSAFTGTLARSMASVLERSAVRPISTSCSRL